MKTVFGNMGIRYKLWSISLSALVLILAIGSFGYFGINKTKQSVEALYQDYYVSSSQLQEAMIISERIDRTLIELIAANDQDQMTELGKELETYWKSLSEKLDNYSKGFLTDEEKSILTTITSNYKETEVLVTGIHELVVGGQREQAYQYYEDKTKPVIEALDLEFDQLITLGSDRSLNLINMTKEGAVSAQRNILIMTAVSVFLGIVMTRVVYVVIGPQLVQITEYVGEIASGDLSEETFKRIKHSVTYKDEVGQLTHSIMQMRANLHMLIYKLSDYSEVIRESSSQLFGNADETSKGVEEVAHAVTDIAGNTDQQMRTMTKVSEEADDMASSIATSLELTTSAERAAEQTLDATREGDQSISEARQQMQRIEENVSGIADRIHHLELSSMEIGELTATISAIADQTNLLALNAAIEAARAGEQGKGFSVVADEVRKLAESSQESAGRITDLVQRIQMQTGQAVKAMAEGSSQVKQGMDRVERAGKAFNHISLQVEDISNRVQNVSGESKSISKSSENLKKAMDTAVKLSHLVSGQTQSISANVEEQSAALEELANSSEKLSDIAINLKREVEQFKL